MPVFFFLLPRPLTPTHSLIILRTPHPSVDRGTEGREGGTPAGDGGRAAVAGEDAAGQAAGGDAVGEVVARPEPLDAALDAAEHQAHHAEVLGRAPRPRPHVLEADGDLAPQRQRRDRLRGGRAGGAGRAGCAVEGRVVGHLFFCEGGERLVGVVIWCWVVSMRKGERRRGRRGKMNE